jgi:hypothetical protein
MFDTPYVILNNICLNAGNVLKCGESGLCRRSKNATIHFKTFCAKEQVFFEICEKR